MALPPQASIVVTRVTDGAVSTAGDLVAVEEPLEIRIRLHDGTLPEGSPLSVTMRTPGDDEALALGFLHGEGLIRSMADVASIGAGSTEGQVVAVQLAKGVQDPRKTLERNFYMTSSCGVCGKASLDAVRALVPKEPPAERLRIHANTLQGLPRKLTERQSVFAKTGGLHAAALVSADGEIVAHFEDVGRHNAVDKLIGAELRRGGDRLQNCALLLSGRASFELVQKAAMARIELIAAIGAPSSLAIELAASLGITLVGFLRASGFNVYVDRDRVALER